MLNTGRITILDGATGINLQRAGLPAGVCPELWITEHPSSLISLQKSYADAGSDAVYAPTFGANRVKLAKFGLADRVSELNKELVALSKSAVGGRCAIGGDMSPLGLFIRPFGDSCFEDLYNIYREQAEALAEAGVDFFAAETLMTLPEARAALLAVRSVSDKPFICSFTFEKNGRTLGGTDAVTALTVMQALGADAFGINCSTGPELVLKLIEEISPYARIPLLAKPNAGLPELMPDGTAVYHMSPDEMASYVPAFVEKGVCLLGGCCGTEPSHIAAIAKASAGIAVPQRAPSAEAEYVAATERKVYRFASAPVLISGDIDYLDDAEPEENEAVLVNISSAEDVVTLEETQHMLRGALVLSGEKALVEAALRVYNGRAFIAHSSGADEKYGAMQL